MTISIPAAVQQEVYALTVNDELTVSLQKSDSLRRFTLGDLIYFALIGKEGRYQLRLSTKKQTDMFAVEGPEAGLLLHQAWLACPKAIPIVQHKGCPRPRSRFVYHFSELNDGRVVFRCNGRDNTREISRTELPALKLVGSSIGQAWKWWLDPQNGYLQRVFYVEEAPEVYDKLFAAWAR